MIFSDSVPFIFWQAVVSLIDFSHIASATDIWREWRFEPWKRGAAEGLYRRVTLIKGGLIGEVARYYADDYIVFKYSFEDVDLFLKNALSESDLMVQRYVFLQREGEYFRKKRALMCGFKGFAEVHRYTLNSPAHKDIEDIAFLANAAYNRLREN